MHRPRHRVTEYWVGNVFQSSIDLSMRYESEDAYTDEVGDKRGTEWLQLHVEDWIINANHATQTARQTLDQYDKQAETEKARKHGTIKETRSAAPARQHAYAHAAHP